MGYALLFLPLLIFVDPGKGDLPTVSDADILRQTTSSRQISLLPCEPADRLGLGRTAPAPAVGEISCVQTILRGNKQRSV